MRKAFYLLAAFGLFASKSSAQQALLPPSSTFDNVAVQSSGLNAGPSHWDNPANLGAYAVTGNATSDVTTAGILDQHVGLLWDCTAPAQLTAIKNNLNSTGGSVRAIFVGETAGWLNSFGYTYAGVTTDARSYTVFKDIQTVGPQANISFGQYIDLSLVRGQASTFDFWFNAAGGSGPISQQSQLNDGGVYLAFGTQNLAGSSQFLWAQTPLSVNTWIPALGSYRPVDSFLVTVEDWRISSSSDRDYSDFRFALQYFDTDGMPLTSIPESASWALWSGVFALSFTLILRLSKRRIQKPVNYL